MKQTERPLRHLVILLIYALVLALVSLMVIGLGLSDSLLYLLTIPCILGAFFYGRRVYLLMIFLLAIVAVWVTSQVSSNFQSSVISIIIATVSSIVMSETIHHLVISRRRVEEALRASEKKFRRLSLLKEAILESPEGIIVFALDTNYCYLDFTLLHKQTMKEIWGVDIEVGRNMLDYIQYEPDRKKAKKNFDRALNGEKFVLYEEYGDEKLKRTFYEDRYSPIFDGKDTIGLAVYVIDITERRQEEEERLKLRKLESVGVLAGGIAHDFNNLLTGLFGNMEMAKMFLPADHKSYKFLESAGQSMESATNLTQQLLTFARGGEPIKECFSIGEALTEMAQFSIRGSNARLRTNIAPDLWPIEADKGQLSQVISNLVINAQQAMPEGGTITIAATNIETSAGKYVQITVQDQGVGIAPQHLDKIFDPYFSTKQQGSGLGLASTYSIISKHNGTITVDSALNHGTIFTVCLL